MILNDINDINYRTFIVIKYKKFSLNWVCTYPFFKHIDKLYCANKSEFFFQFFYFTALYYIPHTIFLTLIKFNAAFLQVFISLLLYLIHSIKYSVVLFYNFDQFQFCTTCTNVCWYCLVATFWASSNL